MQRARPMSPSVRGLVAALAVGLCGCGPVGIGVLGSLLGLAPGAAGLLPPRSEDHFIGANKRRIVLAREDLSGDLTTLEAGGSRGKQEPGVPVRRVFDIVAVETSTLHGRFVRRVSTPYPDGLPLCDGRWLVWQNAQDETIRALDLDDDTEREFLTDDPADVLLRIQRIGGGRVLAFAGTDGGSIERLVLIDLKTGALSFMDVPDVGFVPIHAAVSAEWLALAGNGFSNASGDPSSPADDNVVLLIDLANGERRIAAEDVRFAALTADGPFCLTANRLVWAEAAGDAGEPVRVHSYALSSQEDEVVAELPGDLGSGNGLARLLAVSDRGLLVVELETEFADEMLSPLSVFTTRVRQRYTFERFEGGVVPVDSFESSLFEAVRCRHSERMHERYAVLRDPFDCGFAVFDAQESTTRNFDPFAAIEPVP